MRERYQLHDEFVLYAGNVKPHKNLERLIEAFDLVRKRGLEHLKLVLIGDEISKYAALRRAVHSHQLHKYVRFLGLPPGRDAGGHVPARRRLRLPVPVRRLRASAARSDGERHAGRDLQRLLAARGRRRRRGAGRSVSIPRRSRTASSVCCATKRCAAISARKGSRARGSSPGKPRCGACVKSTGKSPRRRSRWPARRECVAVKVALVHDWLTGMRGGEKVLEVLCERYPDAELFTLLHVRGSVSPAIERLHDPHVGAAAPAGHQALLPRVPPAVSEAHRAVRPRAIRSRPQHEPLRREIGTGRAGRGAICYCLTPMRYAWDQFDAYFGPDALGPAGQRARCGVVMDRLARWDRETATRANRYVAISHYVAGRIRRYYNREATVVYPPVDTDFFRPDAAVPGRYALGRVGARAL